MTTAAATTAHDREEEVSADLLKQQLEAERLRSKSLDGELEAEKMKTRGMQVLFDCMQEEHCENRRLKRLAKKHRQTLQKLRRCLQACPDGVVGQMNWDDLSDLSEVEESTAEREIQHRRSTQDGEQERPTSQRIESLSRCLNRTSSVDQLLKQTEQLTRENKQIVAQFKSSGCEKDAEILNLRALLCDAEQSRKASETRHDVLSEEMTVLKRRLLGTAEMCERLTQTLDMKRGSVETTSNTEQPSADEVNGSKITQSSYQQKYEKLEKQLTEVVTMNSRWQQYNEQREEYVQQLLQRNFELEQAVVNREQQLSDGKLEQFNEVLIDQRLKLELAREEISTLKSENQRLRNRLGQAQDEQNRAVKTLRDQFAQDATNYKDTVRAHLETIETLKLQMQTYREDFESERRDRERAQDHLVQLEAQIRSATRQLSLCQLNTSPEQIPVFEPSSLNVRHSPDATLVGRGGGGGIVSVVAEDRCDSGELDLRSLSD